MAGIKLEYPHNWKEIAKEIKDRNNWRCERCRRKHNPKEGYCLTVHHLDGNTKNNEDWNLFCACQRCHLKIQSAIKMNQMFWELIHPVSGWFKPHLNGYIKSLEANK